MTPERIHKLQAAAHHLAKRDEVMARLVQAHGLCTMAPHPDYFRQLVNSIIGQQLSVKAAAAIRQRFVGLFNGSFPEPAAILTKSADELRGVGFSGRKVEYVQDLARSVMDGRLQIARLPELPNEEIIRELVAVKGIGVWTAHMFMMFSLGRLDILATGDLGIRNGIHRLYALERVPDEAQVTEISRRHEWHPYESVACWYVWRSLDNEPVIEI